MSSAEFTEWLSYASLEPFGYDIENYRHCVVAATVANVAPRKKGAKPLKPSDFYPAKQKTGPLLSPRQERQLIAKRKRDQTKRKA
jgi:hypothetical protein